MSDFGNPADDAERDPGQGGLIAEGRRLQPSPANNENFDDPQNYKNEIPDDHTLMRQFGYTPGSDEGNLLGARLRAGPFKEIDQIADSFLEIYDDAKKSGQPLKYGAFVLDMAMRLGFIADRDHREYERGLKMFGENPLLEQLEKLARENKRCQYRDRDDGIWKDIPAASPTTPWQSETQESTSDDQPTTPELAFAPPVDNHGHPLYRDCEVKFNVGQHVAVFKKPHDDVFFVAIERRGVWEIARDNVWRLDQAMAAAKTLALRDDLGHAQAPVLPAFNYPNFGDAAQARPAHYSTNPNKKRF